MSSQQLKQQFDRDGYTILRGFLSSNQVDELSLEIDRFVRDVMPQMPPEHVYYEVKGRPETLKQLQLMFQYDAWFKEFFYNDRFAILAALLLDGPVVGKNLQWFNKPPRIGSPTPPHQDGYYFMITPNEAVTMWLALDDVDEENGCLAYLPGSHRQGIRNHGRTGTLGFSQGITDYGQADLAKEVKFRAKPGDLLVHHSLTIHRADPNQSNRNRRAIGSIYYSARAKEDVESKRQYQQKLAQQLAAAGKI